MNVRCKIHDVEMKIIPSGTSKKTGKRYSAFTACPVVGCKETGPTPDQESWVDTNVEKSKQMVDEIHMETKVEDDEIMRKADWQLKDKRIARIAIAKAFIARGEDFDNAMENSDLEKWFDWVWNDEK